MHRSAALALLGLALLIPVGCGSSDAASSGDEDAAAGADGTGVDGGGQDDTGAGPTSDGGATPESGPETAIPPATPTVSSWLGTNVSADLSTADVAYQLNAFDGDPTRKDPQGYPLPGDSAKSATDIGFVLPSGSYKIAYKGDGTLKVSGIGALAGWVKTGDEQRSTLTITGTPGAFGNFLNLEITNAAGQSVHDVRILSPGFDYDTKETFIPQFLRLLKPFRALRFMDWESTNGSKLVKWADRATASRFGASPAGQPLEHLVELVNLTGKDCWLTVPEHVDDDYLAQLARLFADKLDFGRIAAARTAQGLTTPFALIVENSNETWNKGFTVFQTFLDAANANAARYPGTYTGTYGPSWQSGSKDLMKVGQYEADRLVKIGKAFHAAFDPIGKGDSIAPVLSGWAIGAAYSDVALRFIKDNYGDPKAYVRYVALAPYFAPDDTSTGSLEAIFSSANANIDSMDATFQDFAKLAKEYGIAIAGYEGGQSMTGNDNLTVKHLAQHDARMYDAYNRYFALWKKDFGESLFMHFSLAGDPGLPEFVYQYGFWGSIAGVLEDPASCAPSLPTLTGSESVASVVHHCPKYRALMEQVPH